MWCYPLPLVYGLYACENVKNYGWTLSCTEKNNFQVFGESAILCKNKTNEQN